MKIRKFRPRRSRLKHAQSNKKRWSWSWKKFFIAGSIFIFLGLGSIFVYASFFLPSVKNAHEFLFSQSSIIYDRSALDPENDPNDHILYVIHGDENREYIKLEDIPQHVKDATLAIEDDRFYRHFGFDILGITKAALNYFFGIGEARGGSTITQQLVKNTFLSPERTLLRKFNEILIAIKVEAFYTKDEILELYLNHIPYGSNAHGIEAAAKTFFDKSARELTLAESSILAGLPNRPTTYSPYGPNKKLLMGYYRESEEGEKEYLKGRKDLVLERMLELDMISYEEFEKAWIESNNKEFRKAKIDIKAPHFVFFVRQQIEEKFGKELLKKGGLRIYTTLDPELQKLAEETIATRSVNYESQLGANNVALTSINPDNGEILAYVGGRNFFDTENDGQVDVLTSRRQPGSSFKPFVYAGAFQKGYTPSSLIFDVETDFGGNYQPQNFDGEYLGPVSMRESLNRSLNIPAVKAAYLATPKGIFDLVKKLGIKIEGTPEKHSIALGVGVAEVEPLSLINAYQVFTNDGTYYTPESILEIHNAEGKVLEKYNPEKNFKKGLDAEIAGLVRNILTDEKTRPISQNEENSFDWNTYLQLGDLNNGAKTGTSNRMIPNPDFNEEEPEDPEENPAMISVPGDAWTIGFTPYLVTGVWVGNNKGQPMKRGSTGMTVAAPIWRDFMLKGHKILYEKGIPEGKLYTENKPLEVRKINKYSGKIATELTPPDLAIEEVFPSYNVPIELDNSIQEIEIDRRTFHPATAQTPFTFRTKTLAIQGLSSLRPDMPNWQAPVKDWLQKHPRFITSLGTIREEVSPENLTLSPQEREQRTQEFLERRNQTPSPTPITDPIVQIQSPKNRGSVSPGTIQIKVAAFATQGIESVEYYLDQEFATISRHYPWEGQIQLPENEKSRTYKITAVVTDKQGKTNQHEIEINTQPDTVGPTITFIGPLERQEIINGSFVHILVDAQDDQSGVRVVEFYLNGQSLGFADRYPFEIYFSESLALGPQKITAKAWDLRGNVTEKSIAVSFVSEKIMRENKPTIQKITPYPTSLSVDIVIPHPDRIEWIELLAQKDNEIIFNKKILPVWRYAQFQIQKRFLGNGELKLITKYKNKDEVEIAPLHRVDL